MASPIAASAENEQRIDLSDYVAEMRRERDQIDVDCE
jgi:hypothetical protein